MLSSDDHAGEQSPERRRVLSKNWMAHLQQLTSLVYLLAGIFLLYLNWKRLHRESVLLVGIMFILYSIYRFLMIRRWLRGRSSRRE